MDKFVDLLDPQNAPEKKGRKLPSKETQKIEIHEDTKTKTVFLTGPDSLRTTVTSVQQALDLIKRGNHARTTAATNLNSNSSRSHSILTFFIESRDNGTRNAPVHIGKLHLVDLAGSERLSRSGKLTSKLPHLTNYRSRRNSSKRSSEH